MSSTNPKNETNWLEWKVGVDLSAPEGRFAIAKQILGFSNRDPAQAIAAEGCAYVVLGAEPGNLAGQPSVDNADLTAALRRYVGDDGPVWSPLWVTADGSEVLLITVEPPRVGDPIHTLRREYGGFPDGVVFVRRPGATHQASAAEQRMLQARLLARAAQQELGLEVVTTTTGIRPLDISEGTFDPWLDGERERLLAPLRSPRQATSPSTGIDLDRIPGAGTQMQQFAKLSESLASIGQFVTDPEERAPADFESEVENYLAQCKDALPDVAKRRYVELEMAVLEVALQNTSVRNLPAVELHLTIEGPVFTHRSPPPGNMPSRPRPWGPRKRSLFPGVLSDVDGLRHRAYTTPFMGPGDLRPPPFTFDNHGSTTIRYEPRDVRPMYRVPLRNADLLVLATDDLAELKATWYATSTGIDGIAEGGLVIELAEPIAWSELEPIEPQSKDEED